MLRNSGDSEKKIHDIVVKLEECIVNSNYWGLYTKKNGYRKEVFKNLSSSLREKTNELIEAIQFEYDARINLTQDTVSYFKHTDSYYREVLSILDSKEYPNSISHLIGEIRALLINTSIKLA